MNATTKGLLVAAAVGLAACGGYWWGSRGVPAPGAAGAVQEVPESAQTKRKILYYRNPMGLPDTSPVPKKDPMGMDYIAVYEGEEPQAAGNEIRVSTEKVQRLGVRTEPVAMRELTQPVRAVGTVQIDEQRIHTVAPKFEGWIERLHVATTGQPVGRGQPLMEVYSPDLVTAQQEYVIAAQSTEAVKEAGPEMQAAMRQLKAAALARLRNWDISDRELERLEREGTMRRTVTFYSPVSGVVIEKPALKGMRFMPGEALYQISDLSSLWVLADVFEQDLGLVRPGQAASISVNAYPGRSFKGKVAYFYPTVTPDTRTGKVRIELANPGGLLKPAMYATVELAAGPALRVLAVPRSAVIDSGVRRVVLVQLGEGRFEPRQVKLGAPAADYVEVVEGLQEGEAVVVAANFLIDAESNLKAALGAFTPPAVDRAATGPAGASVSHRAQGTVESIDAKANTVSVEHGPVPSIKWPAMTMEFSFANPSLAGSARPGAKIAFEFVERKPGEYVITQIEPAPAARPDAGTDGPKAGAPGHSGH
jgi:RND family efflux transporter MFP subunit